MTSNILYKSTLRLCQKEVVQNLVNLLFPGLFYLPLAITAFLRQAPVPFGPELSIAALIASAVLAIVYGLQGFAREADKKTMDFILSRPISLPVLIGVKLLFSTGVFALWLFLFQFVVDLDLSKVPFPTKLDPSWCGVVLIMLNSMGFIAGLITRGAERLVVTVVLTGLVAGLSYGVWLQCFDLMSARYFWFDIPPHIYGLVARIIPWTLLLLSLWIPWVLVLWYLKGKPNPLCFPAFRRCFFLWAVTFLLTRLASLTLGPALWPADLEIREGDWHLRSGLVLTATPPFSYSRQGGSSLYLAKISGKPYRIYTGNKITNPRWSPLGDALAFVEDGQIKIYHRGRTTALGQGNNPTWSGDGRKLAYTLQLEKDKQIQRVYALDLTSKKTTLLGTIPSGLLDLVWDSDRQQLYGAHQDGYLYLIDLAKEESKKIKIPSPVQLAMRHPRLVQTLAGDILLSLAGEHEVQVYSYQPGRDRLVLLETKSGREVATVTQSFISPDGAGFLWPRIDGAFEYQGIIPPHDHDHPGHEHCLDNHHHEHDEHDHENDE
ncbi:MAG TPA: hypothetical protein GX391_08130 [Firmicutes bacterium]|jgi:hypothetical protein|nr:hypothetical protein [Bacillota bacterium]HOQ23122.1 hypothetical protein [Bacillota bacterium]HPT67019.1 hypothetical protein [Bacillota bacterium]